MPKIVIDIPDDINKKLKKYALDNGRSLSQFLPRYITACVENSIITLDERGEFVVQPTQLQVQSQSSTTNFDIEQLQEQGVSQIKFNKPQTVRQLTPEEEELHQARLQRQLASIKQQRIKFLLNKSKEILGYTLPYLEQNNLKTIDWVLNKYPTDEDIITYLQNLKTEDENYIEEDDNIDNTTKPQSEYYQKIKRYYTQHLEPYEFEDLMSNVRAGHIDYLKDYHQLNMFDALNIPHSHSWTDNEWNEMIKELSN